MASSDRVIYRKRAWLNRAGFNSTAFVFAEIIRWKGFGGRPNHSYTLKVGDCDRQIALDFGDGANDIYKLDTLLVALSGFRDKVLACQEYDEEWQAACGAATDDDE